MRLCIVYTYSCFNLIHTDFDEDWNIKTLCLVCYLWQPWQTACFTVHVPHSYLYTWYVEAAAWVLIAWKKFQWVPLIKLIYSAFYMLLYCFPVYTYQENIVFHSMLQPLLVSQTHFKRQTSTENMLKSFSHRLCVITKQMMQALGSHGTVYMYV